MKKVILVLMLCFMAITVGVAQVPPAFAADILGGVTKITLNNVQNSEVLTNFGAGAIYRFFQFDPIKAEYSYDVALGAHVFTGYTGQQFQFSVVAGASLFDGWFRFEPGYDFANKTGIVMISTSFGYTFPGTL